MAVDPTWQWIFGILHCGVAAFVIFLAARGPVRTRDWTELRFRLLVLVGGALGAVAFEGAVDRAGQLWYATHGQWPMVTYFGISVPLWVAPVYLWFVGGGTLLFIQRIRAGARLADLVRILLAIVVADFLLEPPIIKIANLYTYYGDTQPFYSQSWFPLPAWYVTTNLLFDLLPALVVLLIMSTRKRHIEWTIPVAMLMTMYAAYASVGWPIIAALANGSSKTITTLAAVATMMLGLASVYLGVRLAPRLKDAMRAPSDSRVAAIEPSRRPGRSTVAAAVASQGTNR
jgi:hypothetical protein